MPAIVGVDIGTSSIKTVILDGDKEVTRVVVSNSLAKLPTTEAESLKLAEEIKKNWAEFKIQTKKVKLALSETAIYSRVITMPVLSDTELASAISWEAEQYIPVPLTEVELSWEVVYRPVKKTSEEKMRVLLVAANKVLIKGIVDTFAALGIEIESIEPESLTTARMVLDQKKATETVLICNIGASVMTMAIYEAGKIAFIYRFDSGGVALTRAIASSLQLAISQAEEYKRAYGVTPSVLEGRLMESMKPVLEGMISGVKKVYSSFSGGNQNTKIDRAILAGGAALMPGLVGYFSENLGFEVSLADPYGVIKGSGGEQIGAVYISAIGAAKR